MYIQTMIVLGCCIIFEFVLVYNTISGNTIKEISNVDYFYTLIFVSDFHFPVCVNVFCCVQRLCVRELFFQRKIQYKLTIIICLS